MRASLIAQHLDDLARFRNLEGGVHGHSIGYRRAADAIAQLGSKNITSVRQLDNVKYVGPKTKAAVHELLTTGAIAQVEQNRAHIEARHKSTSAASAKRRRLGEQAKSPTRAGRVARRRLSEDEGLDLEDF